MSRSCRPTRPAGWPDCAIRAVARALALMHGDIARPWSVEELGRAAGMSRSALAERFSRLIGMAPMHYLAHWRMQMAAQKLQGHQRFAGAGRRAGRL